MRATRHAHPAGTRRFRASPLAMALLCTTAFAQHAPSGVRADGSVTTPAAAIPYSAYASPQARALFLQMIAEGSKAPPLSAPIAQSRDFYDRLNSARAARMEKLYPVTTHRETMNGVSTDVVLPAQGIAARNRHRVLVNLHGGAFLWGARSGALVESIPIASLGRIKVISVDYRQGPEHVFPAASEDVEAVYRALLKQYPAKNIGIYGCSAGGVLTGEAVARIITKELPVPGAIGTFCGSVSELAGDSTYIAPMLNGAPSSTGPLKLADLPYFKGASASDPLVFPANSPALLAKFPPTLLITGTRDFTMSAVLHSQALLAAAGVDAELHVWDGMWHSFFSDPEMPESREAYAVMVSFFDRRLGH
ncbi:alpha/beta hydrolase [Rhodanobacter umsongensis]|uniref:Alpha/beta hydrolase n=1 Tax=Rhodanobacter umsongensis TaxID=633153 RepID=A0ABW0JLJ7_9GAMM